MNLPRLLRVARIPQSLAAELLTSQVKRIIIHDVVAVYRSAVSVDSEDMAAEYVLRKERGYSALP